MRLADRFAYLNHDIDDAVRAGILDPSTLPAGPIALMGDTSSERIDALVHDLVERSDVAGDIVQSQPFADALAGATRIHVRTHLPRSGRSIRERRCRGDGGGALQPSHRGESRPGCGHRLGLGDDRPLRAESIHGARVTRIKDASVEDVRAAVDMVDLVSGKTTLRRSGSRFVGRCPFHDERTASFSVDPVKKVYHCFGCQKGGDHIGFVIETEGLDFVTAVEWLADRYGVKLEYEDSTPEARKSREQRDRLLRLLDDSAVFYTRYLWETTEAEPARRYLAERGLTEETAKTFRVGYAPGAWDRLCVAAIGKGFTAVELDRAGLSVRGRQGPVDRLRARIMFPLSDPQARVRGFGGRQMPDGEPPKYKNSPDGPMFRKSDIVYGLDHARAPIARAGEAIVVEGYTDVLALHQAGIENVVASMGTALTAQQVTELKRVCSTLLLAFDADAAGQEASVRGIELALAQGIVVRVVALPSGRDPADVALDDPEAFRRAASEAVGVSHVSDRADADAGSQPRSDLHRCPEDSGRRRLRRSSETTRCGRSPIGWDCNPTWPAHSPPHPLRGRRAGHPRPAFGGLPGRTMPGFSWACAWRYPRALVRLWTTSMWHTGATRRWGRSRRISAGTWRVSQRLRRHTGGHR